MRTITVNVSPAGSIQVDANGFKGKGCDKATEQIEIALGGAAKRSKKKKPEFFASPTTGVKSKATF